MLTLISGAFHPHLEHQFLDRIKDLKSDPLAPILVVTPSSKLMEQLHLVLARENLSYLNIHFHTFSSLAQMIVDTSEPLAKPILSDSFFYDALIRFLIKDDNQFHGFEDLDIPQGFPVAVRSTLRDLMDAGVPSDVIDAFNESIRQEIFKSDIDVGQLMNLLRVYKNYSKKLDELPVFPRIAILKSAISKAPQSDFLKQFKEIIYYGFYDLTGLQSDFFQAVVKHHPCRFFFPFVQENPAYQFASRFRDAILQPVIHEEIKLNVEETKIPTPVIMNVSGRADEAWCVAQEILKLHDEVGISFQDMAVVARRQDRLRFALPGMFSKWKIPFNSSVKNTLGAFPQGEIALQFLSEDENLPENDSWSGWVERVGETLESKFKVKYELEDSIWTYMIQGLEAIKNFDLISKSTSKNEFLDTLRDRWSRTEMPAVDDSPKGVSLLYAEAARGLSFKVIFLIGMDEREFPRIIREDPFLRDDARLAIFNTLGYKINRKLDALEEERLLFHLIVTSAENKLYLIYQRSNDEGHVVGMSAFLRSFAAQQEIDLNTQIKSVPRPMLSKLKESDPRYLGHREILYQYLSKGHDSEAVSFAKNIQLDSASLANSVKTHEALEKFDAPGAYDGLVGADVVAGYFLKTPLSPTGLETYGRCGFQFFAKKIWGLKPLLEEAAPDAVAADVAGTLVHSFFFQFFQAMRDSKKSPASNNFPKEVPKKLFEETFDAVFKEDLFKELKIHSTVWKVARLTIRINLEFFIKHNLEYLHEQKGIPYFFEEKITTLLDAPLNKVTWEGIVDRIDIEGKTARIVDYKTGRPLKKNIATAAMQGIQSQPPIYILLAEKFLKKKGIQVNSFSFAYLYVMDEEPLKELTPDEWVSHKQEIIKTIVTQLDEMKKGNFSIMPDTYCSWCEVAQLCRKFDSISAFRSEQGPVQKLWELRKKKA